ncbi:MAG: SAM-dependent methyltransferase [Paracoccaceae bacterium]
MERPALFDRAALARNRARATDAALHEHVAAEVEDRLTMVNRRFTRPAVVTPAPGAWGWLEGATLIPDAPTLNLSAGAHDLVVHAMALHWAEDPVGQLIQMRRALVPDGLALAVLPGGRTLVELREALARAEAEVTGGLSSRVAPMADIRDLGGLMARAGLAMPVADARTLTLDHADPLALMRDLRAAGEQGALAARPRRATRRAVLTRAAELMPRRPDGRVETTVELITLTGWAPAEGQPRALRPGSATHRLEDALARARADEAGPRD